LGAGTSLPGVVAAKCGANVTLSDCSRFTKCLENCRTSAVTNGVGDKVKIISLQCIDFINVKQILIFSNILFII
jgi:predicted nicotinamide N-methyase